MLVAKTLNRLYIAKMDNKNIFTFFFTVKFSLLHMHSIPGYANSKILLIQFVATITFKTCMHYQDC